jgi:hypothetical protein
MDQFNRMIDLLLLCAGPCLFVYSAVAFFRTRSFLRCSIEVAGEVIRLEHSTDRTGTTTYENYAPVFSFTAVDGKRHTVTSDVWSSPADSSVGEAVRVRYDPPNPEGARIHTLLQTWGTTVIPGVVGVAFVAFGCWQLGLLHFK